MINKTTKFLIIGLGLIGGSYSKALKKAGFIVYAITDNQESIDYALENNIIDKGAAFVDEKLINDADIVIFALYPKIFLDWIDKNASLLEGKLLTDVTGVKSGIVDIVQSKIPKSAEFISAHPMAGREVYGVQNSDETIFYNANYIVVPTEKNTEKGIRACEEIGKILNFATVSVLSAEKHDEMIAYLSQLTHCIAVCLMTANTSENLENYTGDSFRDLTRIANINEYMWTELFLMNKNALLDAMQAFIDDFSDLRNFIAQENTEGIYKMMRLSSKRRALFNKKEN